MHQVFNPLYGFHTISYFQNTSTMLNCKITSLTTECGANATLSHSDGV